MNLEKKERVGSIWVNAKSHHGAVRVKIVSTCWTKKSKGKSRRSSEEEEGGGEEASWAGRTRSILIYSQVEDRKSVV